MIWISVKTKLPAPGQRVIIAVGDFVGEGYLDSKNTWRRTGMKIEDYSEGPVEYWMDFPKTKKEQERQRQQDNNILRLIADALGEPAEDGQYEEVENEKG